MAILPLEPIIDVGADLGRVFVPFIGPMPVDFPAGFNRRAIVGFAPILDGLMCVAEPVVWAKMRCRRHLAGRQGRADDLAVPPERGRHFRPDLQVELPVRVPSINGDVPTTLHARRLEGIPHRSARFRYNSGKLVHTGAPANDRDRNGIRLLGCDDILHMSKYSLSEIAKSSATFGRDAARSEPARYKRSMDDEIAAQLAARDRLRRKLPLRKTPAQRMADMAGLQEAMWATLRRTPDGYRHFLRRNFKARAISAPITDVR